MSNVRLFLRLMFCCIYFGFNSYSQELNRIKVSDNIEYIPINTQAAVIISYADLPGIGRIGTNHLVYFKNHKAFLFDTPNDNYLAGELYRFVKDSLKAEISMVSVSHWHQDHSGGLDTLHKLGVQSYSYYKTKEIMENAGLTPSLNIFNDSISINFEGTDILLAFCGAGHTSDNSIGWVEGGKILFSGSVIRSPDNRNLGYLKDADLNAWPKTVENIQRRFGNATIIIPGHGNVGGSELILHTVRIIKTE